jgi:hypothetical protein
MSNLILTFLLLVNVTLLTLVLVFFNRISIIKRQITSFITPESDGKPSPLANSIEAISEIFGRSITAQIKTSLMGVESGLIRGEKAVNKAIADDSLRMANPLIAGLLDSFPSVKKTLSKNPALLDIAISQLSKRMPSIGSPGNNHQPESPAQVKWDL